MHLQRGGYQKTSFNNRAVWQRATATQPPSKMISFARFSHVCQEALICKSHLECVPYFNAPIYVAEGEEIGKVDEIFGALREFYISIKLYAPLQLRRFSVDCEFYVDAHKLLPVEHFVRSRKPEKHILNKRKQRKRSSQAGLNQNAMLGHRDNRKSGFKRRGCKRRQ